MRILLYLKTLILKMKSENEYYQNIGGSTKDNLVDNKEGARVDDLKYFKLNKVI